MTPLWPTLSAVSTAVALVMLLLWLLSLRIKNVSIVDIAWGPSFALIAGIAILENRPTTTRCLVLFALTSVWALRLALYLLYRNWGLGEDRRYAAMRKNHGASFAWVSFFTVFLLQGVLLVWISLPLQVAAVRRDETPLGWLDYVGALIWCVGFVFEAVGDLQMAKFQADPNNKDRVMDQGLWRYTRHPNYFGDFCVWWGLYLIASAGGAAATVLSPLTMSLLLLRVSGVSLLERTIAERRPSYADYRRRTNAFFPWWPKR